ncbi:MAG: Rnase Y domain-containing protein, partial [Cetobacterium sp.]
MNLMLGVGLAIVGFAIIFSIMYKKSTIDKKIEELNNLEDEKLKAKIKAKEILERAEKESLAKSKEIEIKAKETVYQMKEEAEKEIKIAKNELLQKEGRLAKKEETLESKIEKVESRAVELEEINQNLENKKTEIEDLKKVQEETLERISEMTRNEAKEMLISKLKDDLVHETALAIREYENKLEDEKDRLSKRILSTAIGKASSEFVADATVSVVNLPNDEMKGRIIGREGRNIRTIEALTGVDIIIDDTPEAVVLSSFDGVKREVARRAIEKLMHMEIIKTLGKLKYRTSYGQNVLTHSIEVAKLAANLAAELGADTKLAKRAGLLHDVGKVLDHDIEASHAIIGGEFLKKFGEKPA